MSSPDPRTPPPGFSPCERRILARLLELTTAAENALAALEPWQVRQKTEVRETVEWGPRYVPSVWFGKISEAKRKRYWRALGRLQSAGLVELIGNPKGTRMESVRFTEAGRAATERIEAATTKAKP